MAHDATIGMIQWVLSTGVNLRYLYVDTVGDQGVTYLDVYKVTKRMISTLHASRITLNTFVDASPT